MKRIFSTLSFSTVVLATVCQSAAWSINENDLRGPIVPSVPPASSSAKPPTAPASTPLTGAAQMGGLSAPNADALMTPDMLLVAPTTSTQQTPPVPLSSLVGNVLKLTILKNDVTFAKFHGFLISVTNNTNRPLVINGDLATAVLPDHTYSSAPISAIQQSIIAPHSTNQDFELLLKRILPAALSIGAVPTIRDIEESRKPVLERYGPDELRRKVEFTRFGRRILWTNQKVDGILYFQTDADIKNAQLVIPATTLFDAKDTSKLTSTGTAQ